MRASYNDYGDSDSFEKQVNYDCGDKRLERRFRATTSLLCKVYVTIVPVSICHTIQTGHEIKKTYTQRPITWERHGSTSIHVVFNLEMG